jgi:hypothetical protein
MLEYKRENAKADDLGELASLGASPMGDDLGVGSRGFQPLEYRRLCLKCPGLIRTTMAIEERPGPLDLPYRNEPNAI